MLNSNTQQFEKLIESPSNNPAFSLVSEFLNAYINKNWDLYYEFLSKNNISKRIDSLDFSFQNRITKSKYKNEILPKEMTEENIALFNYEFLLEEEVNSNCIEYTFRLDFVNVETKNKFTQNEKIVLVKEGKEWKVEREESVINNKIISFFQKYIFNWFVGSEFCCVV